MPSPAPNSWLSLLFNAAARRSAAVTPLKASLNLSTTIPQTTPPTENFQTEISTVVTLGSQRFTLSSGGGASLQISRSSDPALVAPTLLNRLTYGTAPLSVSPTAQAWVSQSVASFGSLVAVALSPQDYATNGGKGVVRFYRQMADGSFLWLKDVEVGYLPDGLAFNSTGTRLVVANEGEPTSNYAIDRAGSIGIIAIGGRAGKETFAYTDLKFDAISLPPGLRISGPSGTTQATDIEPEYVSVLGNYAYVTLQENNGVAKVNLSTSAIEQVFDLGSVDFSQQLVDISDTDGGIKPVLGNNVYGLRMADGIAAFTVLDGQRFARGRDYFITANEGDSRDYGSYIDELRRSTGLTSRLKTLKDDSTVPYTAFGSRSVSIFDAVSGALVWDSGNSLQTLAIAAGVYDDLRSDDKGVEPEGIVTTRWNGRQYAIVGLERTSRSMLVVFDITNPVSTSFVTSLVIQGSLSPEGLSVIEANKSPSGRPLLVVSNEVSNTLDYVDIPDLLASQGVATAGAFAATMLKDGVGSDQLAISSLITAGEVVNGMQPGFSVYVPPGFFDGMGAYDNNDGTYTLLVNHELASTAGYQLNVAGQNGITPGSVSGVAGARISRFVVAKDIDGNSANGFQSKVLSGGLAYDTVISPDPAFQKGGFNRFCSANFAPAAQFSGRGFVDSLFLLGEESGSGRFFALDPAGEDLYHVPAFGLGGWESATALDTGSASTVAVMLFDDTSGIANYLYLWVGTKDPGSADLLARNGIAAASGSLYAWKASDIANTPAALNGVSLNTPVNGGWVLLGSGTQVAALPTATALRSLASAQGAMTFVRIEDGAVDPVSGRQVAFNSTGGSGDDLYGNTNIIDLSAAFDASGQLAAGASTTLRVLVDADRLTGVARQSGVRNPDNIEWSANGRLYIQEDRSLPAGVSNGSFGSEEASIWSVDVLTGVADRWAQIDRSVVPAIYGQSDSATTDVGNWESSGVIDVSAIYGASAGTFFLADVQAHSLTNGNLNGSSYLVEGGQIDLIRVVSP